MTTLNPIQSSTNLYRRLSWQATVPIAIRLADGEPGAGSGCDIYYLQAPRFTYLPLLIPEIRDNLVGVALDDEQMEQTNEKDWWFEEEVGDEHGGFASIGACRWHWPIDLLDIYSYISRPRALPPILPTDATATLHPTPRLLKLILHLSNPPQDRLLMPNSIETCKSQWLNQVKEADFVRWRNTSRVTSLRRGDLEAGWDGILQDDFDLYTRMSIKILPLPLPPTQNPTSQAQGGGGGQYSRPPSTDPSGQAVARPPESAYNTRSIPIRIHLPDNAPVVQEVVSPVGEGGTPTTIIMILQKHLPLLFPASGGFGDPWKLAFPVVQGIVLPPEAEMAWVASCLGGGDGWVRVGICVRQ